MKFRLKVKINSKRWKVGTNSYNSLQEANKRVEELSAVGIVAKVYSEADLFDNTKSIIW